MGTGRIVKRAMQGWVSPEVQFERYLHARSRLHVEIAEEQIGQLYWLLTRPSDFAPRERAKLLRTLLDLEAELKEWRQRQELLEWATAQRKANPGKATDQIVRKRLAPLYEKYLWSKPVAPPPRPVMR